MKKTNKVLAVLLVALMTFAISGMTAFAAAPEKGTIQVSGAKADQTYTLYKLFDAKITFNEDGTQRAIAYTTDKELGDGENWFKINDQGFVEVKDGTVTTDWAKDPDAIKWAKTFGTTVGETKTAASDGAEIKWDNLEWGYYFVDSTLGAFISVTSDNPTGTIADKNELPTLAKKISAIDKGSKTDTAAIAEYGSKVSFELKVGAKVGAENYKVVDTLDGGLTVPAAADVKAYDGETAIAAANYDVDVTGQVITVTFKKVYLDTITANKDITIKYDAVVNNTAVIGAVGNKNSAVLSWGHNTNTAKNKTQAQVTTVYTAQITITKKDDADAALAKAGFVIKKDNKFYKLDNGVVTWVDSMDNADEKFSGADGVVPAFTGLADGTYTMVEKTVPDGFNKMEEKTVTIKNAAEDVTDTNLLQTVTVQNKTGVVLPATGGLGTTLFTTFGLFAILAAGVFLVTNKRIAKEEI